MLTHCDNKKTNFQTCNISFLMIKGVVSMTAPIVSKFLCRPVDTMFNRFARYVYRACIIQVVIKPSFHALNKTIRPY